MGQTTNDFAGSFDDQWFVRLHYSCTALFSFSAAWSLLTDFGLRFGANGRLLQVPIVALLLLLGIHFSWRAIVPQCIATRAKGLLVYSIYGVLLACLSVPLVNIALAVSALAVTISGAIWAIKERRWLI